jgi:hypothetical protein
MCSPLVPSMSAIFQAFSELQGVAQYQELIDLELLKMGAFPAADMTPQLFASAITMPNLTIQVRDDAWTKNPEDAQKNLRHACNQREGNDLGLRTQLDASRMATTTSEDIQRRSSPSSKST